jgi:hypothetical protein
MGSSVCSCTKKQDNTNEFNPLSNNMKVICTDPDAAEKIRSKGGNIIIDKNQLILVIKLQRAIRIFFSKMKEEIIAEKNNKVSSNFF